MSSTATRPGARDHRSPQTGAYSVGVAVVHPRAGRDDRAGWLRQAPVRLFGGGGRMIGLDVARGLAVLGLVAGVFVPGGVMGGGGVGSTVDVGAMILLVTTGLFVLVAGVSATRLLAAGGDRATTAAPAAMTSAASQAGASGAAGSELSPWPNRSSAALRLAVRSGLLFALGAAAVAFSAGTDAAGAAGGPAVMLQLLGALSFLALLVRGRRARSLFIIAGAGALVLPVANAVLLLWADPQNVSAGSSPGIAIPDAVGGGVLGGARELAVLVASGAFPLLAWCAPFFAGMAIGRLPEDRLWRPFTLLAVGGGLSVLAAGGSLVVGRSLSGRLGSLLASADGSVGGDSPIDILCASAVALTVLALCLILARPLRWALLPLAAAGSLALTISTVLFVMLTLMPRVVQDAWSALGNQASGVAPEFESVLALATVLLGTALLATLWTALAGAGPMEQLMSAGARLATRDPSAPRDAPAPASPSTRRATFAVDADIAPLPDSASSASSPHEQPASHRLAREARPETLRPAEIAPDPTPERVRFSLKQPLPEGEAPPRGNSAARDEPGRASTGWRVTRQKPTRPSREPAPRTQKSSRRRESVPSSERNDAAAGAPPEPFAPPGTRWNSGQSLGRLPY